MESALEYIANKQRTLINNYRTPDNQYAESCCLIALDIAERLLEEGKTPHIILIRGKVIDSIGNRQSIIPKPYDGRVTWGAHQVCCVNGIAYDPMISKEPISIKNYANMAFFGDVDIEIVIGRDKIREFINR
jgi:hypothetical protein